MFYSLVGKPARASFALTNSVEVDRMKVARGRHFIESRNGEGAHRGAHRERSALRQRWTRPTRVHPAVPVGNPTGHLL